MESLQARQWKRWGRVSPLSRFVEEIKTNFQVMKRLLLPAILSAAVLGIASTAEAKHHHDDGRRVIKVKRNYHDDHDRDHDWKHHDRTRTIYVIENHRPVERVVYVDDGGRYYRYSGGSRTYVRGRYFTSYPSRYYYNDGRPRIGVSINF